MHELALPLLKDEVNVGVAVIKVDKILVATDRRVLVVSTDARGSLPGSETKLKLADGAITK